MWISALSRMTSCADFSKSEDCEAYETYAYMYTYMHDVCICKCTYVHTYMMRLIIRTMLTYKHIYMIHAYINALINIHI